ncbi:MAG TPA: tetratricopeptide repeat protein [Thermoanaerobaculia bacterium]|nr:tetratricopeptide repeat protein [Thermoanaerobaculia bacterium]
MKLLLVSLLLSGAPSTTAAQAPPAPALAPAAAALVAAQERLAASDLAGAIAALEPLRAQPDAPRVILSMLGALYLEAGRGTDAYALLVPLADEPDADPAVLFNAARAALAAGLPEKGRGYLERAAKQAPVSPAGRELGLIHAQMGDAAAAYSLLRPWAVAHPEDLDSRLAAALLALQLGRNPEAQELLAGTPEDHPKARLLRGKLLLVQGDPRGALKVLRPLEAQHPPEMEADLHRMLADAYLATGDSAAAIALLEKGDLRDRGMALLLAEALYQRGEMDRALERLRPFAEAVRDRAAPPRPEDARLSGDIARAYGRMLVAAGRHAEAVPLFERATQLRPDEPQAWQGYGQALMGVGRRDEAQKAFARFSELAAKAQEAATAAPNVPGEPALRRAGKLMELGQFDKALEIAQQEAARAPADLWPRVLSIRALLQLRRLDEALQVAQDSLRLAPDNPDVVYQRGVVHLARRELDRAESDFRRALQLAPAHVPSMNDLAVLLMSRGDMAQARGLLEKVLELKPDDAMAARNLQKLKEKEEGRS